MICDICASEMRAAARNRILGKYDVQYFVCPSCQYLCTEKPYWLSEAYSDAIVASDTGLMDRNIDVSQRLAMLLYIVLGVRQSSPWLDAAGGYGILTRLMRDIGFNFAWYDKYSGNLVARGFESHAGPYEGVTAIEAIEHMESPREFVAEAVQASQAKFFVFTTNLYNGPAIPESDWWYYGLNTGQHISFFTRRTLDVLAAQFGMVYYPCRLFHVFSSRPISKVRLAMVTGKSSKVVAPIVRRLLGSKAVSDFNAIVGSPKGGR